MNKKRIFTLAILIWIITNISQALNGPQQAVDSNIGFLLGKIIGKILVSVILAVIIESIITGLGRIQKRKKR